MKMETSLVKVEKVSYEKVMNMKERMMLSKNGVTVIVTGLDKWKDGKGTIAYCMVNEDEKSLGMKWLSRMASLEARP